VVPHGDAIDSGSNDRAEVFGRHARPIRSILGIGNYQIQLKFFAQSIDRLGHNAATRLADDVSNEQDPHAFIPY